VRKRNSRTDILSPAELEAMRLNTPRPRRRRRSITSLELATAVEAACRALRRGEPSPIELMNIDRIRRGAL